MSAFVVKAIRPDGRVSWLAQPTRYVARHLGPRESAATFDCEADAQAEIDAAAEGYELVGIKLAMEWAR